MSPLTQVLASVIPSPAPGAVPTTPTHGSWPLIAIVLGLVLSGVATLALAWRNGRRPGP